MANSKRTSKSQVASAKAKAKKRSGKAADGVLRTNDVAAEQALAANELAAAVPFNATKKFEYGHDNAAARRAGATVSQGITQTDHLRPCRRCCERTGSVL